MGVISGSRSTMVGLKIFLWKYPRCILAAKFSIWSYVSCLFDKFGSVNQEASSLTAFLSFVSYFEYAIIFDSESIEFSISSNSLFSK